MKKETGAEERARKKVNFSRVNVDRSRIPHLICRELLSPKTVQLLAYLR